jgi:hypothetical protein
VHYVTGIRDPRGKSAARHFYTADGRLDYTLDAHDKKIDFEHRLDSKQEVITNRRGFQTVMLYDSTVFVMHSWE